MLLVENSLQVEAVDGAIAGSAIAAPTDALSGNDNGDALAVCQKELAVAKEALLLEKKNHEKTRDSVSQLRTELGNVRDELAAEKQKDATLESTLAKEREHEHELEEDLKNSTKATAALKKEVAAQKSQLEARAAEVKKLEEALADVRTLIFSCTFVFLVRLLLLFS
jgi:septal ring factor EnvC (AmiA/AmiB activator)